MGATRSPCSRRPKRRRRSPESAEREILAAAEAFLRERPFRDLTVDEVMARTTLSRPSFYVYFRDRHHLAVRLVEGIGAELFEMADALARGSGDPRVDVERGVRGIGAVYARARPGAGRDRRRGRTRLRRRGDLPRADRAVRRCGRRRIEDDIASGRTDALDARETARALVWMSERYLNEALGRLPQAPVETVVETLSTVWVRDALRTAAAEVVGPKSIVAAAPARVVSAP